MRRGRIIGSAAVLKTAVRKDMQVRVLSPPPFLFNNLPRVIRSPFLPRSELARSWRASGVRSQSRKGPFITELTVVRVRPWGRARVTRSCFVSVYV